MEHYLSKIDETTNKIISTCFPKYKGRKIKISTNIPTELQSYWNDGSRDLYCFYELATGKSVSVHSNHPFFEANQPSRLKELPKGFVIVMHRISYGKDMGITIYANQDDIAPLIPQNVGSDLSKEEKIVLIATRSYKSSYGGIGNYRFIEARRQTKITALQWEEAKASLIAKGFLDKRGALTATGKNTIGWKELHQIKYV